MQLVPQLPMNTVCICSIISASTVLHALEHGLAAACSTHAAALASIDWPGYSLRHTYAASSDWLCSSAVLLPAMA